MSDETQADPVNPLDNLNPAAAVEALQPLVDAGAKLPDPEPPVADSPAVTDASPAAKPESFFERIEDDVIRAAEEAAYATSNLIAAARGRKPDDGIDAWRKRTGGLWGAF